MSLKIKLVWFISCHKRQLIPALLWMPCTHKGKSLEELWLFWKHSEPYISKNIELLNMSYLYRVYNIPVYRNIIAFLYTIVLYRMCYYIWHLLLVYNTHFKRKLSQRKETFSRFKLCLKFSHIHKKLVIREIHQNKLFSANSLGFVNQTFLIKQNSLK